MMEIELFHCPTCKKPIQWSEENRFRPFCCERCRMIDLGAWVCENYKIDSKKQQDKTD